MARKKTSLRFSRMIRTIERALRRVIELRAACSRSSSLAGALHASVACARCGAVCLSEAGRASDVGPGAAAARWGSATEWIPSVSAGARGRGLSDAASAEGACILGRCGVGAGMAHAATAPGRP
jgi:hypothetical protein